MILKFELTFDRGLKGSGYFAGVQKGQTVSIM